MHAPRTETYLAFSALIALSLLLSACCGDGEDDSAAEVAADEWTSELLVENRAAFICTNFYEEVQADVGELPAEGCEPAAATFMFEHIPYDSFFSPLLARECINAAEAADTYSFWMWCFNAWVT